MKLSSKSTILSIMIVLLAGCDNGTASVKETLGITKQSPDEFMIMPNAKLTVPPEFNLRPPHSKGADDGVGSTVNSSEAAKALISSVVSTSSPPVEAVPAAPVKVGKASAKTVPAKGNIEDSLLNKFGSTRANPDIRKTIDAEAVIDKENSKKKGLFGGAANAAKPVDRSEKAEKSGQ